jgi:hypothetical protein
MTSPEQDKIRLTFELNPDHAGELMRAAADIMLRHESPVELVDISPPSSPSNVERQWKDSPAGYYRTVLDPELGKLKLITRDKLEAFAEANGFQDMQIAHGIIDAFSDLRVTYRPSKARDDEPHGAFLSRQRDDSGIYLRAARPLLNILENRKDIKVHGLGKRKTPFIIEYLRKTVESLESEEVINS